MCCAAGLLGVRARQGYLSCDEQRDCAGSWRISGVYELGRLFSRLFCFGMGGGAEA